MRKLFTKIMLLGIFLLGSIFSQVNACEYTVVLYDSYGDGWNGGSLNVLVNGQTVYSGLTISSGSQSTPFVIEVSTGDEISADYTAGSWSSENSYKFFDSDGNEVWSQGNSDMSGLFAECPGLGIIDFIVPSETSNSGSLVNPALVFNNGTSDTISAFTAYVVFGTDTFTQAWTGFLLPGETDSLNLSSSVTIPVGNFTICGWLNNPLDTTGVFPVYCESNFGIPSVDAGIVEILAPSGQSIENSLVAPIVVLKNFGFSNLTSCVIEYTIDGASLSTYNWSGMLTIGESDTVVLPEFTVPGSPATLCANTVLTSDAFATNDSLCSDFDVVAEACNYAMHFDGFEDFIEIMNDSSLNSSDYSIEAWVKPESFGWLEGIVSRYLPSSPGGFVLRLSGSYPYKKFNFNEADANYDLTANTWYHLAAVQENGVNTLYINGVPFAVGGSTLSNDNNGNITIGSDYGGRWFNGFIDEVRIWKTALSQTEISDWAIKSIDASHPDYNSLAAYYQFDQPGGMAVDSKNSNDGIIHNALYAPSDLSFVCGDYDANMLSLIAPAGQSVEGDTLIPQVLVQNLGNQDITSMNIYYSLNGGTPVSYTYSGTILSAATDTINLPYFISPAGSNSFVVWSELANDANALNDTLFNSFDALPVVCNYGLDFNGNGAYGALPAGSYFGSQFSVQAWVYKRSNAYDSKLMDFGNGNNSDNVRITLSEFGSGKVRFSIYQGNSEQYITSTNALPLNQWVHLAITYDGVNGKIYFNGVEEANGPIHQAIPMTRNDCWIGKSTDTYDDDMDAIIDEFSLWNTILLPQTIVDNMFVPVNPGHPNYSDLEVYYNFNQPVENPVSDQIGMNDLTRLGTVYSVDAAPVVCDPFDAAITSIIEPVGTLLEGVAVQPVVLLTNIGVQPLTNVTIYYTFGVDTLSYAFTDTIFLGMSDSITLGQIDAPFGAQADFCVWVEQANDANQANNQLCESYPLLANSCNYALYFDGNSDYVSIPVSPETEALTSTYTLECWIKPEEFGWLDGIISKYQNSGGAGFTLRFNNTSLYNTINFDEQDAGISLNANQWYHLAAVNNNGIHKLYINGVEYLSSASAVYMPNNSEIRFGSDYGARWFKGLIDEVRIWNTALSGNQITQWMSSPVDNSHPEYLSLVGYWQFNDLASVATDSKSYHDGIIHDAVYVPCDAPMACGTQDVGITSILLPQNTCFEGNLNPVQVEVFNYGTDAVTSMDINYSINGGSQVTYTWNGMLLSTSSVVIDLPAFYGPAGNSTIVVSTDLFGDDVLFNNTDSVSFTSIPANEVALSAAIGPESGCGLSNAEHIELELQNNGDSINGGLILHVMNLGDSTSFTELVTDLIQPNQNFTFTFANTVDLYVGTGNDSTYQFMSWLSYLGDADSSNDTLYFNIEAIHASNPPLAFDTTVVFGDSALLLAQSATPVFWYETQYGGNSFLMDTFMWTPPLYDTTTYWIESSESVPMSLEIGTGTSGTNYTPCYGYYNYSWSASIYEAAEIAGSFEIQSIWYYVNNTPGNYQMNDQKIYFKHISNTIYSSPSAPDVSGMTLVYDGSITWDGTGWHEIVLDQPFQYNGNDNLEIVYMNWDGSWASGYPQFRYTNISGHGKYRYQDSSMPGDAYSVSSYRPNIKFVGNTVGCPSERIPITAYVANIPDYDISVTQILTPFTAYNLSSCETVSVEIKNWGAQDATNFTLTAQTNTGYFVTEYYTGTLASGQSDVFTFTSCLDLSAFGSYDLCVYPNWSLDMNLANDTLCTSVDNMPLTYCSSGANYSSYIEVVDFAIGNWNNYSGPATGATYTDFTSVQPAELIIGQNAQTMVDPDHYGYSYATTSNYKIYIDYNQDGIYDPVNEMAFGTSVYADNASYGQISVPANALPGITGMRLVFNRTSNASSVQPCGTYSYGETEDYFIILHEPLPQDAGIVAINEPSGFLIENQNNPVEVELQNFGSDTLFACTIVYTVDGLNPVTENWTGSLAPFTSETVDLTSLSIPVFDFDLCAYTILAGDTNSYNDTTCVSLYGEPQNQVAIASINGIATACNLGTSPVEISFENQADTIFPGTLQLFYEAPGFVATVNETNTDTILPGQWVDYTFATPIDQSVSAIDTINLTAWLSLQNDPFTYNDSITISYVSALNPADPVIAEPTIFANQLATVSPLNLDSNVVYSWYNQYMSLMTQDFEFTSPVLLDTTMFNVQASLPASMGGCQSNVVPFNINVEFANYDIELVDITEPFTGAFLSDSEMVVVELYNNGLNPVSDFPVTYVLNNGTPVTETVSDTIQPGDTYFYSFSATANLFQAGYGQLLDGYGVYDLCAYTALINDGFTGNDSLCVQVENMNGDGEDCTTAYTYGPINEPAVNGATYQAYDFDWWKFEATGNYTNVGISLCGSTFDTKLEVWDSCSAIGYMYYNDDNYSYCSWSLNSYINIPYLTPGTYYVKVYGYSSNFGDYTLEISGTEEAPFTIDLLTTDSQCFGDNSGAIDLTVNNLLGVPPFNYLWSNGEISEDISGLQAGIYSVSVWDANNDTIVASAEIFQPDELLVSAIVSDVTSLGGNDGAIDLSTVGGTSPYSYTWNTLATDEDLTNLYGGSYTVTVSDASSCETTVSNMVGAPLPSNWSVTSTPSVHTIVIPQNAAITLDAVNIPYGSYLGVFYNQGGVMVCGGYVVWNGYGSTLEAYGTEPGLDNGFEPNETFTWKLFDVNTMDEYNATPQYNTGIYPNEGNFVFGGLSGIYGLSALSIITQNIDLPAGWSIWSTYIDPVDPDISSVLSDIVAPMFTPGPTEIVKSGSGLIFWPYYGLNTIGNVTIGEGYQIKINGTSPVSFGVTGLQIVPELTPFTIPNGWSIIAYLRTSPADITAMLSPIAAPAFTPGNLEIAKNGAGLIYWPFYGLNTIGNMIPGEGYQVKLTQGPTTFNYPANSLNLNKTVQVEIPQLLNYKAVKATDNNMTIGIPDEAWNELPLEGSEIVVRNAHGEVLGAVVYQGGFTAITLWGAENYSAEMKGSEGSEFSMAIWNPQSGVETVLSVDWVQGDNYYRSNAIHLVGKVQLSESTLNNYLGQSMPNPAKEQTIIPFTLKADAYVEINLFNSIGEFIKTVQQGHLPAGSHKIVLDVKELPAGNYFYQLKSDDFTSTKNMIVQ